jgi:hypothetical protein
MQLLPIRLSPGVDLRRSLEEVAMMQAAGSAFVVADIGSLGDARLRYAGEPSESTVAGPLEIMRGTLHSPVAMSRRMVVVLALALFALPGFAAGDEGQDKYTIRPSHIPTDAPRFSAYPATVHAGPNAAPDVQSDPRSKRYRTQLRSWGKEKPNFAGHYILATWGCGTGCTEIAVIDAVTGAVFHPMGARTNSIEDVDADVLVEVKDGERRGDFGALQYRADSRLLVLIGKPDGRPDQRGISYFVWDDDRLARIRFVAIPSSPNPAR